MRGSRAENWGAAAIIVLACLWAMQRLFQGDVAADEGVHGLQIVNLAEGRYRLAEGLTMLPGYHVVLMLLSDLTGARSSTAVRALSTLVSLPAIPVFYLMVRRLQPRFAAVATLQFAFLPVLFPFFFLLYTDGLSLLLVLLSVLLVLREHRLAAAGVAILAVLVRQTNIICLAFVLALAYVEDHGFTLSRDRVVPFLRRHLLFVLALAAFAVFVLVNRGVALGDGSAHPLKFRLGNVYLFLFLYFFVLLPVHLAALPRALAGLRDPRVLGFALALFGVFMFTFVNDHPYNLAGVEAFRYSDDATFTGQEPFLHNQLLDLATRDLAGQAALLPAGAAVLPAAAQDPPGAASLRAGVPAGAGAAHAVMADRAALLPGAAGPAADGTRARIASAGIRQRLAGAGGLHLPGRRDRPLPLLSLSGSARRRGRRAHAGRGVRHAVGRTRRPHRGGAAGRAGGARRFGAGRGAVAWPAW